MSHTLEQVARSIGSGIGRRDALKAVLGTVVGAAGVGVVGHAAPLAKGAGQIVGGHKADAFALRVRVPTGQHMLLWMTDRHVARTTYKGQTLSFVPHFQPNRQVEVSMYRGAVGDETLLRRVTLPIQQVGRAPEAKSLPVEIDFMPQMTVAAVWTRQVEMMPDFDPEADCRVMCCYGMEGNACAVCCNELEPACGECCDAGCCPGCS
jgi:hypothetical protein